MKDVAKTLSRNFGKMSSLTQGEKAAIFAFGQFRLHIIITTNMFASFIALNRERSIKLDLALPDWFQNYANFDCETNAQAFSEVTAPTRFGGH